MISSFRNSPILLLFILCLVSGNIFAQGWQAVGPSDTNQVTHGYSQITGIVTDKCCGNAYIIADRNAVKKFDGSSWTILGSTGGVIANAEAADIAITDSGVVYVAYYDNDQSQSVTVMKYSSNTWSLVGNRGFSGGQSGFISLALDKHGNPYVSFINVATGTLSVMKYIGSSWIYLMSGTGTYVGSNSIAIDTFDNLYLVYTELYGSSRIPRESVWKFNGSWLNIDLILYEANYVSIACDKLGIPYVALNAGNGISVLKYINHVRSYVGNSGFTSSSIVGLDEAHNQRFLTLDDTGVPYVAFAASTGGKANVMKFSDTAWVYVGNSNFSFGQIDYTSIAVDHSGTPYFIYEGFYENGFVMKYDCNQWEYVGNSNIDTDAGSDYIDLAVSPSGIPYIAYSGNRSEVRKYTGSSWTFLDSGLSPSQTPSAMTIDKYGVPYILFTDSSLYQSVKKYNGSQWIYVGNAGAVGGHPGSTVSMQIDSANNIFVAYTDQAHSNNVTVMKYNGIGWTAIGGVAITSGGASFPALAIDRLGTPYVAFQNNINSVSVMKYDSSGHWVFVGNPGFSGAYSTNISIAIDTSGLPIVFFDDYGHSVHASVMKYNGSTWNYVGSPGFSPGPMLPYVTGSYYNSNICIDRNGTPYVIFADSVYGYRISVMKYNGINWTYAGPPGFTANRPESYEIAVDTIGDVFAAYTDLLGSWLFKYGSSTCLSPSVPVINPANASVCAGTSITLSVQSGQLDSATHWQWYSGACGGTAIGSGISISVSPITNTIYYARGEGGCVVPGSFGCSTISTNPTIASVSVSATRTAFCMGNIDTFNLASINPGSSPVYQWYLNGAPVGINSRSFAAGTLNTGDSIWVTMISNAVCIAPTSVISNKLIVTINPIPSANLIAACRCPFSDSLALNITSGNVDTIKWYEGSHLILNASNPNYVINSEVSSFYHVKIVANGCYYNTDTVYYEAPAVCAVTVDTMLNRPVIIWQKYDTGAIASYYIYRFPALTPSDTLPVVIDRSAPSVWEDTMVAPSRIWSYSLAIKDTCGRLSHLSPYIQVIYLYSSPPGVLNWNEDMYLVDLTPQILGSVYNIYRDNLGNGNWSLIASITAGSSLNLYEHYYQDIDYALYPNARYMVSLELNNSCGIVSGHAVTHVLSNIISSPTLRIDQISLSGLQLYPNPADNQITISVSEAASRKITIRDLLGRDIYENDMNQKLLSISTENWVSGVYLVIISEGNKSAIVKVVKY